MKPVHRDLQDMTHSAGAMHATDGTAGTHPPERLPACYAIVPAAGKGTRMGASVRKQFLELDGVPVLIRTLSAFERSALIDGILVAAGADETASVETMCTRYGITKLLGVVAGGATRFLSVTNAIDALERLLPAHIPAGRDAQSTGGAATGGPVVLIHDGARPFIQEEVIRACAEAAARFGAAICGVPVKDTVKIVGKDGRIGSTVPREGLWAVQTPQAFRLHEISAMHREAAARGMDFTDDAQVAEHFGHDVHMVMGDYTNIKLTTSEDLILGDAILRHQKAAGSR